MIIAYLTKHRKINEVIEAIKSGMESYLSGKDYEIVIVNASDRPLSIEKSHVVKNYNITSNIVNEFLFKIVRVAAINLPKSIVIINGDNRRLNEDIVGGIAAPTLIHGFILPLYFKVNPCYYPAYSLITYPLMLMLYGLNITFTFPLDFSLGLDVVKLINEYDYANMVTCNFNLGSILMLIALSNGIDIALTHMPSPDIEYEEYYKKDLNMYVKELLPLFNMLYEFEDSWLKIKVKLSYPTEVYVAKRTLENRVKPRINAEEMISEAKNYLNRYASIHSVILGEIASDILRQFSITKPEELNISDELWAKITINYMIATLRERRVLRKIKLIEALANLTLLKAAQLVSELEKLENIRERMLKLGEKFIEIREEFINLYSELM